MALRPARLPLVAISLLLCACSSAVDPRPFTEFSLSVRDLRSGTDAVLAETASRSRERVLGGVEQDLVDDDLEVVADVLTGLKLEFVPGQPFGWSRPTLPHLAAERFRGEVRRLQDELVRYADLLLALAETAPLRDGAIDSLAARMNAGTVAVLEELEVESAPEAGGILSVAATAAFRDYHRSRRKKDLERAIATNQRTVDAFARHLQRACEIAAEDLQQTYLATFERYRDTVIAARGTTGLRPALDQLLAFNQWYMRSMGTLREIHQACGLLPAAHRDLLQALRDDRSTTQSIRYLAARGQELKERYDHLLDVAASSPSDAPQPDPGGQP